MIDSKINKNINKKFKYWEKYRKEIQKLSKIYMRKIVENINGCSKNRKKIWEQNSKIDRNILANAINGV